jgi:hypothetical protein
MPCARAFVGLNAGAMRRELPGVRGVDFDIEPIPVIGNRRGCRCAGPGRQARASAREASGGIP